jgi:ABC-type Zn uptake system ZnuABC Zn-binding protein ZnuA
MIKRIILISISIFFIYGLYGQKKSVIATASMMADMAQNIAGDLVDIKYIVPRGQDPHLYKPTPSDVIMVQKSDLILVNGLTFEGWIAKLIENSGSSAEVVTITEGIHPIQSSKYANSFDPHAWMDVNLVQTYILNIKDALIRLLPEYEEQFNVNYLSYSEELKALDKYIEEQISSIPETQRILITSHDAFAYFGRRYGMRLEAIVGISTEAEVQSSDIIRVHKAIKESKVPSIFMESTINPKILQQIAKDNDIVIGGELYADSLGEKGSPADTYIKMLRHNAETIVKGLTIGTAVDNEKVNKESQKIPFRLYGLLLLGFFFVIYFVVRKLNNI